MHYYRQQHDLLLHFPNFYIKYVFKCVSTLDWNNKRCTYKNKYNNVINMLLIRNRESAQKIIISRSWHPLEGFAVGTRHLELCSELFIFTSLLLVYCTVIIHASSTLTESLPQYNMDEHLMRLGNSTTMDKSALNKTERAGLLNVAADKLVYRNLNRRNTENVAHDDEDSNYHEDKINENRSINKNTPTKPWPQYKTNEVLMNKSLENSSTIHKNTINKTKRTRLLDLKTDKLVHSYLTKRGTENVADDDDDSSYHDDEIDGDDSISENKSAKGKYVGAPCNDMKCEATLMHVICDRETLICGCEKNYPVQLGHRLGCDKPKNLGEQCFSDETCMYNDENSLCVQVQHNALCECASGFHSVSYVKPTRRVFCTQDLAELNRTDFPTLLGVTAGIGVLAGLICMVLHLFSKTKYPRRRNFGDANLPPPIMYSGDTGMPLTVRSGRPSSRSSLRSSGSIGSCENRRASITGGGGGMGASGSKGILVSTSRTGSRRPSLASVHSTSSSVRSYSIMRFEKEVQQKEIRQEMKVRLARLQQLQQLTQNKPQIVIGYAPSMKVVKADNDDVGKDGNIITTAAISMSMSPMTPHSTDELLPALDELHEYSPKEDISSVSSISYQDINAGVASKARTSTSDTIMVQPIKTSVFEINANDKKYAASIKQSGTSTEDIATSVM